MVFPCCVFSGLSARAHALSLDFRYCSVCEFQRMTFRPTRRILVELRDAVEHCLGKRVAGELQGER